MAQKLFDLTGKVAIVTGSARGLGKAMALGLAEAGAKVTISARTRSEVEATANEFRARGHEVLPVVFDATKREDCQRLLDETLGHWGKLDVMHANHGGGGGARKAEDTEDELWDRVIAQNLTSAFYCCQIAARQMMKQGSGGSIILTSSTSALVAFEGLMAYGAAKGGVDSMVRQMALEWGKHKIRINAIDVGYTTHRRRGYDPNSPAELEVRKWTPLGRSGAPEEFSGPAVFLASDASSFVTGVSLPVDGGWMAV